MAANEAQWSTLLGVQMKDIRDTGTLRNATFASTFTFKSRCESFVQDLKNFTGHYGSISYIVCGGTLNQTRGTGTMHYYGRAFDLDIVRWSNGSECAPYYQHHATTNITLRRRYVAMEAVVRRSARFALNGFFDSLHRDHIHFDDSGLPLVLNKNASSDVKYIQHMMNSMMGKSLSVDGAYGPATDAAYREAKQITRVTGDTSSDPKAYADLNWQVAYWGFRAQPLQYYQR